MKPKSMRMLPIKRIPRTIVDSNGDRHVIRLPAPLSSAYMDTLKAEDLYGLASAYDKTKRKGATGGESQEEANQHFADRFTNSAARILYLVTSPCRKFDEQSDLLVSVFSYGTVSVLDAPAGAGAGATSLIALLIALRETGALPSLPLNIHIVLAEFSQRSAVLGEQVISPLVERARRVGIHVEYAYQTWDATKDVSTAKLVDYWFENSSKARDFILLTLNFSDALSDKEFRELYEPSFRQISSRLYDKHGAIFWVEPEWNKAGKIREWLEQAKNLFGVAGPEKFAVYKVVNCITNAHMPSNTKLVYFVPSTKERTA